MTGWTEDRVERMKQLWADGDSASDIAKKLRGTTRNAVIGKIHRLGLGGRATPSRPVRRMAGPVKAPKPPNPPKPRPAPRPPARAKKTKPKDSVFEPKRLSGGDFVTVATLKDTMCKWPIGDPADADFHYCGHDAEPGSPYCGGHSRRAYWREPAEASSRRDRNSEAAAKAALDAAARRRNQW